jgi:hypothetical protein
LIGEVAGDNSVVNYKGVYSYFGEVGGISVTFVLCSASVSAAGKYNYCGIAFLLLLFS